MASGTATVTAGSGLNIREGAGTNYAKCGSLAKGAKVSYVSESNGWLCINYQGKTGYICKQYTSVTPSSGGSGASATTTSKTVRVTASALNVRNGAGTGYGKIGLLSNGDKVEVTGEKNGWYSIKYNNQTGWISAQYTAEVSGGTTDKPATQTNDAPAADNNTDKPATSDSSMNEKYTVTASVLNVRKGPSASNDKLGSLSCGQVVTVKGSQDGWYKIDFSGKEGWICGSYVVKGDGTGPTYTGTVGAGGLSYLTTKQVAAKETGRKPKTIVDLTTKKQFNVSWDACATYHSDCTPMTSADTTVIKSILNASKSPDDSYWKNINSWSWAGRPGAIQLKDGTWVACGFHLRPHAAIMGGNPGYPFQNESNTPLAVKENGSKWRLGGHFCLYYGDSPGGTQACNEAAKKAKDMSI